MMTMKPRMLDPSRLFQFIKCLAIVLLLLYLLTFVNDPLARDKYAQLLRSFKDEKDLFTADFLVDEVGGSFDGTELSKLCASKPWHPDDKAIVLTCSVLAGGIGRVKNEYLQCIRFAIEIGAQLVLPRIARRSHADITILHGDQQSKGQPADYMFSSEHLIDSLGTHCPQMKVYSSLNELYDKPSILKPLSMTMGMIVNEQFAVIDDVSTTILSYPQNLRRNFQDWLDRELPTNERRYPVRVELQETLFVWPAHHDGEAFRRDFGHLLRVRDDIRLLAASGLWNLARRFGLLGFNPGRGIGRTKPNPNRNPNVSLVDQVKAAMQDRDQDTDADADTDLDPDAGTRFLGVHLRTEKDAQVNHQGFPDYEEQTTYFLSYLLHTAVEDRVVYLATGLPAEDPDVRRFRAQAAELNATVVTKWDVFTAAESATLRDQFTWDQRALVDYEIMMRAGFVLGLAESSFSWNLAMRRGNAGGGGGGGGGGESSGFLGLPADGERRPASSDPEELVMWRDRYSRLYGRSPRAMSMFFGIWP